MLHDVGQKRQQLGTLAGMKAARLAAAQRQQRRRPVFAHDQAQQRVGAHQPGGLAEYPPVARHIIAQGDAALAADRLGDGAIGQDTNAVRRRRRHAAGLQAQRHRVDIQQADQVGRHEFEQVVERAGRQ